MSPVWLIPCLQGTVLQQKKKRQEKTSYLSEKQLQEAIKAQKCIQQKQFLVALSLWQYTCSHLHRERERSKGITVSEVPCLPFSLAAISHYNAALFTFNRCGQKMVKQREAIWTNQILLREHSRVTVRPDERWPTFKQCWGCLAQKRSRASGNGIIKKSDYGRVQHLHIQRDVPTLERQH